MYAEPALHAQRPAPQHDWEGGSWTRPNARWAARLVRGPPLSRRFLRPGLLMHLKRHAASVARRRMGHPCALATARAGCSMAVPTPGGEASGTLGLWAHAACHLAWPAWALARPAQLLAVGAERFWREGRGPSGRASVLAGAGARKKHSQSDSPGGWAALPTCCSARSRARSRHHVAVLVQVLVLFLLRLSLPVVLVAKGVPRDVIDAHHRLRGILH